MNKISVILAMVIMPSANALAQSSIINACGIKQNKVCVVSKDRKSTSCYKTKFAENFQVCKSEQGYFICCEVPGDNNSTYNRYFVAKYTNSEETEYVYTRSGWVVESVDKTVPANQSFVNITPGSY